MDTAFIATLIASAVLGVASILPLRKVKIDGNAKAWIAFGGAEAIALAASAASGQLTGVDLSDPVKLVAVLASSYGTQQLVFQTLKDKMKDPAPAMPGPVIDAGKGQ